jgi:hypothetical protein
MPKGPRGEKRPADVIGAAIMVAKIATGEIDEDLAAQPAEEGTIALARVGGLKGGPARAARLSSDERRRIAKAGAEARWGKNRKPK